MQVVTLDSFRLTEVKFEFSSSDSKALNKWHKMTDNITVPEIFAHLQIPYHNDTKYIREN